VAFYGHRTTFLFKVQYSFSFCLQLAGVDNKYMVDTEDVKKFNCTQVQTLQVCLGHTWREMREEIFQFGAKLSDIPARHRHCVILSTHSVLLPNKQYRGCKLQGSLHAKPSKVGRSKNFKNSKKKYVVEHVEKRPNVKGKRFPTSGCGFKPQAQLSESKIPK
jgi:hypothetical protein